MERDELLKKINSIVADKLSISEERVRQTFPLWTWGRTPRRSRPGHGLRGQSGLRHPRRGGSRS